MNRLPLVFAFGFLLALGGAMEAQVVPPKTQPAKKAKKVWTNEDFPDRPAAKAAKGEAPAKEEAAGAKPEKSGAAPASAEQLAEVTRMEEEQLQRIAELQVQREALAAELKALEEQRDAAPSLEAQGALNTKMQEKQEEVSEIVDQIMVAKRILGEIRQKKDILAPPPPFEGDFGARKPVEQPAKEKEQPKPAP